MPLAQAPVGFDQAPRRFGSLYFTRLMRVMRASCLVSLDCTRAIAAICQVDDKCSAVEVDNSTAQR